MALIADVKCGRCDKNYSALRTRCPYCGARRGSAGKHAGDRDNLKGKVIVGTIFLLIILAAVAVLLVSSIKDGAKDPESVDPTPNIVGEDDVSSVENPDYTPPPPEETPPPATPVPTLESVRLIFGASEVARDPDTGHYDFSIKVGETLTFKVKLNPEGIEDVKPTWSSADTTVFDVVPDVDGMSAKVTGFKRANAKMTITVDGIEIEAIVRVKA